MVSSVPSIAGAGRSCLAADTPSPLFPPPSIQDWGNPQVRSRDKALAKEEGRRKKEEGRRKKGEGRREKEEGRRKKEEGRRERAAAGWEKFTNTGFFAQGSFIVPASKSRGVVAVPIT